MFNRFENYKNIRQGVYSDICIFCLQKEWDKSKENLADLRHDMLGKLEHTPIFFIRRNGQDTCMCFDCLEEQNQLAKQYLNEIESCYKRNTGQSIEESVQKVEEIVEEINEVEEEKVEEEQPTEKVEKEVKDNKGKKKAKK